MLTSLLSELPAGKSLQNRFTTLKDLAGVRWILVTFTRNTYRGLACSNRNCTWQEYHSLAWRSLSCKRRRTPSYTGLSCLFPFLGLHPAHYNVARRTIIWESGVQSREIINTGILAKNDRKQRLLLPSSVLTISKDICHFHAKGPSAVRAPGARNHNSTYFTSGYR